MFRFIHTADCHIDSPLVGLDAYEGAPVEALRGATRQAFDNLVDLALEEKVDFLVIAGDLYDGDWKDFGTGLFFTRRMARLGAADIPVYFIAGNHDAASVLTRHLSLPDNVHQFSTRTAESKEVPGLPVTIHGHGFPHRAVPENLVPKYLPPVAGRFNLGLLHTSLTGAPGHDTYAPCSLHDLTGKGYDYWALGHVHRPQVLSRDPWVVFAGNTQGRHIRETGPRGCRLVTVDDALRVVDAEHRALDLVRWQRLEVDLTGVGEAGEVTARLDAALRQAIAAADGRLAAVRVVLTGGTSLHQGLKHALPRWQAECIARGQFAAGDDLWIERLEIDTAPLHDPADLAARDDLTRIVLESLDAADTGGLPLPTEVNDMLRVLPAEIRSEVEAEFDAASRGALVEDVRAILLDALAHGGGEA